MSRRDVSHWVRFVYDDTALALTKCGMTFLWGRIVTRPATCPDCRARRYHRWPVVRGREKGT